jgi:branched-chain amino acid transport system substrate-binding protein
MKPSLAKRSAIVASTLALGLTLAACGSSSNSSTTTTAGSGGGSSSGSNGAPIKIALVASLTGNDASQNGQSATGFNARIAAQNAKGSINGHKLVGIVIDDQTSPTVITTAVQQAISDGAIGIVANSPLFFLGAKYAQAAGIPVTGGSYDGSEWGTQPNTSMFPSDTV